jgi:hypothetical protein
VTQPVEVRLRVPDLLVLLMASGFVALAIAVFLDGQGGHSDSVRLVKGLAAALGIVILVPVFVTLLASLRAERQWRFRVRLDEAGVHLRKGPIWRLRAVELPWHAIGSAVLLHRSRPPARGSDAVFFLPPSTASSFSEEILAFAEQVKAKDADARDRMWASHRRRKEDVRRVLDYLASHHPEITVREVTT